MKDKFRRKSIFISYLIGTPIGIIFTLTFLIIPLALSDEGLAMMGLFAIYGIPTLGLIVSFLFALNFAAKKAYKNLIGGKTLLKTSFYYSLTINFIIWSEFIILIVVDNLIITFYIGGTLVNPTLISIFLFSTPALIAFFICTILTTFTVGLLICYLIKKQAIKSMNIMLIKK